jgi:hypothetical protein
MVMNEKDWLFKQCPETLGRIWDDDNFMIERSSMFSISFLSNFTYCYFWKCYDDLYSEKLQLSFWSWNFQDFIATDLDWERSTQKRSRLRQQFIRNDSISFFFAWHFRITANSAFASQSRLRKSQTSSAFSEIPWKSMISCFWALCKGY